MRSSSSTMRMRPTWGPLPAARGACRGIEGEAGAATGRSRRADPAPVALGDRLDDGEPEAGAGAPAPRRAAPRSVRRSLAVLASTPGPESATYSSRSGPSVRSRPAIGRPVGCAATAFSRELHHGLGDPLRIRELGLQMATSVSCQCGPQGAGLDETLGGEFGDLDLARG